VLGTGGGVDCGGEGGEVDDGGIGHIHVHSAGHVGVVGVEGDP